MKCPNCGHEMVESRAGHLCLSCGHVETGSAPSPASDANIATGKDSHDQMRAAAATAAPTASAPSEAASFDAPEPKADEPEADESKGPEADAAEDEAKPEATESDATPEGDEAETPEAAPAVESTVAGQSTDAGSADEPPAASTAPPWAAPATDVITPSEATGAAAGEPVPTADDLSAVEKAVAEVEHAVGKDDEAKSSDAEDEEPKAEPKTDEPQAGDTDETSKPQADEAASDDKTGEEPSEPKTGEPKTDEPEPDTAAAAETDETDTEAAAKDETPTDEPSSAPAEEPSDESAPGEPSEPAASPEPADDTTPAGDATPADNAPSDAATPADPTPTDTPAEGSSSTDNSDDSASGPTLGKNLGEAGVIGMPAAGTPDPAPATMVTPATPAGGLSGGFAPTPASTGATADKTPLTPVTHPRSFGRGRTLKIVAIVLALLLVLGGGALAAYLYLISPGQALSAYLGRVSAAKTSTIASSISSTIEDMRFSIKVDGKNDFNDPKKPKLDLNLSAEITAAKGTIVPAGASSSGSVAGQIIVTDQTLYFKILKFTFLSELIPIKGSDDWYKYAMAETDTGKCISKGEGSDSYMGSNILTKIPVKDAKFVGIEKVNGTQMLRYQGVVNNSKIKDAIDEANKNLSAECKLDVQADDFKDLSITYNLWRGWSKDRILISVNDTGAKVNTEIVIDSGDYNQPVDIKAPSNPKDVDQLLQDLAGQTQGAWTSIFSQEGEEGEELGAITEPEATPAPAPAAAGDAVTRDAQRRTDLGAYLAAVKAKAKNGFYPVAAPPAVTVPAVDPGSAQPYSISKAAATAPGHIEYRPGGNCSGQPNTPGKTGTRYFALYTMLESGQAHCVDNR